MSGPRATARIVPLDDPVELLLLAEHWKPFSSSSTTLDRQVLDEHCSLLIYGAHDQPTCLYLWTAPMRDVTPWLSYAGAWFRRYPQWRRLHGLPPADQSVQVVLGAPDYSGEIHSVRHMLVPSVTLMRYTCLEEGTLRSLWWERESATKEQKHRSSEVTPEEDLSLEERGFFRRILPSL